MNKLLKNVITIVVLVAVAFQVHSLDAAKEKAKAEGKLVLADYSAIWCPSCRKLDTQVFANENVAAVIDSKFVYARLDYDTDEGAAFAAKHDLVGFPRVLILQADGEQLTEMPLTFEPSEYISNLEKVMQRFMAN
jgi:thiol:disulfide interchange protein